MQSMVRDPASSSKPRGSGILVAESTPGYISNAAAAGLSFFFFFLPKTILTLNHLWGSWNIGHISERITEMVLHQHKAILSINVSGLRIWISEKRNGTGMYARTPKGNTSNQG